MTSGHQLTHRDRAILAWIGRHGLVTADQVARRFFARDDGAVGKRAALRRLAILQSLGFIRRDPTPFWRAPHILRVTTAGVHAGEIDIAPARLVESQLRHSLALVDLTERLAAENPGAILRTEREIRTDRWHQRAAGTRNPGRGRTPDGELTLGSGKVVAIELDLTPKRSKDFERVLRSYKQERYDRIWWYVLPGTIPRVTKLVAVSRCDDFVEIRAWNDESLTTNTPFPEPP